MARNLSSLISTACLFGLILVPAAALYLLWRIDLFAALATNNLALPVQWETVSSGQWYALWAATALYLSVGLGGLYFLRRAFANFARGELFNSANSSNLRRFSLFLFVQALLKPVHFTVASVLLSFNHPAGEKILSVVLGNSELSSIAVAMVLFVMSDLLTEGAKLQRENRQFV